MGQAESLPDTADAHSKASALPGDRAQAKAHELFDLLVALEAQLADPQSVASVGKSYGRLTEWTKEHLWDTDLQEVLEWLQPDPIYPTWRRQALEEAYRLFYDDAVKTGDPEVVGCLPEPPTSEEIGFRRLPEALVSGAAAKAPLFSGAYEDKSACPLNRRRWEYDIRRTEGRNGWASGREIVAKGGLQQKGGGGPCAADFMQQLVLALLPSEQCCARRQEAPRARGPFFLPEGPRAPPLRPPGTAQPRQAPRRPPRRPPQQGRGGPAEPAAESWPPPRGLAADSEGRGRLCLDG